MSTNEIFLTPEGRQKLVDELAYLEDEGSAEVIERLNVARSFGDLSENSEYDDAKDEQARIAARIAEIRRVLSVAKTDNGSESQESSLKASIGSVIELEDEKGKRIAFTIVGTTETNSLEHRISNESPMGAALMGHEQGDVVEYVLPSGRTRRLTILKVSR